MKNISKFVICNKKENSGKPYISEDLINWVELSRYLAGNESSVSRTRCPKKYQKAVDSLIDNLKAWEEKIKEKPDNQ